MLTERLIDLEVDFNVLSEISNTFMIYFEPCF